MRTGAIVQARMASTRLPGKVLMPLPWGSGISMLRLVVARLQRCTMLDAVIVATTTKVADNVIVKDITGACKYFRGPEDDVLGRYHGAAKAFGLDVVVRITSDCPFIDPSIIDAAIKKHAGSGFHYTSNVTFRTFPRGMDVEVFDVAALRDAHANAKEPYQREHVTPYIQEHFRTQNITAYEMYSKNRYTRPDLRLTVDTLPDYTLACIVSDEMRTSTWNRFTYQDIVALFEKKPWLKDVNADVVQKPVK